MVGNAGKIRALHNHSSGTIQCRLNVNTAQKTFFVNKPGKLTIHAGNNTGAQNAAISLLAGGKVPQGAAKTYLAFNAKHKTRGAQGPCISARAGVGVVSYSSIS